MSRIIRVEVWQVDLAPRAHAPDAARQPAGQETPMVRIVADDGANGTGWSQVAGPCGAAVVGLLRAHLGPRLIGRDESHIEAVWKDLSGQVRAVAADALAGPALAAIDIALWDLRCKRAKLPLHIAAGGAQQRVRMHAAGSGLLQLDTSALVERVAEAKAAGFRAARIQVGQASVSEDVARLEAVRARVGDAFELIADAGQSFTLPEAIRRARRFEAFDLAWLEQPLPADDLDAHARLVQSTSLPIAVGGALGHASQFRDWLQRGACSIVQPDAMRLGGITPWLKVAHLAEAFNVPVCVRASMELHLALCAAVPNAAWVEYAPQLQDVSTSRLRLESGHAFPAHKPGLGIDWNEGELARRRAGAVATVA